MEQGSRAYLSFGLAAEVAKGSFDLIPELPPEQDRIEYLKEPMVQPFDPAPVVG